MDKNSLIQDIKNDLNSIKKQVEVTLAKLAVLESMIELDKQLGVVEAPVESPKQVFEEPKQQSDSTPKQTVIVEPVVEPPVAELVEAPEENKESVAEPEPAVESKPVVEPVIESPKQLNAPTPKQVAELRNLMSIIGLNDRFRFRHDLFSDSNDLFKETIEILNTIENFDKAVDYLQGKFNWDEENATVVYFYDIIKPKF
jgi:preprotein translocase subunit SecD